MIQTGFESRIKVQDLIDNQLPSFILDESPNAVEFLKQYYISQEYQGGPIDLADNLDQYLKLDNLTPEVVVDSTTLSADITSTDDVISVSSTKGFPDRYGILKIDDEIITYTEKTTTSFTGCIRGFSGITNYHQELNQNELVFEETVASDHTANTSIQNLSSLFLKEFYKKLKTTFAPGFENITLVDELDAGNFIKRAKDFYASKGTDESIKILFKVIFGVTPKVINLEEYLIKPSFAKYIRREVILAEVISGDILKISGQTLFKNDDIGTSAPISNIESFSIKGKTYYKIEVFVGNDDRSLVEGTFVITPNTRSLEKVEIGSDIISVDSTVSFPESGTLVSGNNKITYTSKSVNQFFGCSGITEIINPTDIVRNEEIYFSYENGDTSKKVEVIVLGIIDGLSQKTPGSGVYEGDIGSIKSFGDKINNNANTYKEIFANSWIYNTSTRYQIIDNSSLKLGSQIDKSSLKVGDEVEILDRGSENVISTGTYVDYIDEGTNTIILVNGPSINASTQFYDLRRKLNKSSSTEVSFEYGDKTVLSDVLNLYVDGDDYAYVASNSLPSSELVGIATEYRIDIDKDINAVEVSSSSNFLDEDPTTGLYNIINVPSVPFFTGDRVAYSTNDTPITELESNESYYVKKVSNNTFKLYSTLQLLESDINLGISSVISGTHTFTYYPQRDGIIGSQKLLKKIPLQKNIQKGTGTKTSPGSVGMLINGVEINNYKSNDSIYYGPLSDVSVLFGGEDYDVINPPEIDLGSAKVQPVVSGSFEKVYVDTQNYDIDSIVSINISGGNGSGAVIEPVFSQRSRSVLFDGRTVTNGGGVSTTTNQILFLEDHNFSNGEEVVYNPLGNTSISGLPTNSSYFITVDNSKTVKLHTSLSDQQSGINTVSLPEGSGGKQQFSTAKKKNQISYIQVLEKGSGYTNRNLIVSPSGISTTNNTVNFTNHGFSDGEIVEYNYESGSISGLSTTNQYYISKINDNSFRLSDGGIGGTITSNYNRNNYVKFDSTGSGYQYFKYPDISVSIEYNSVGFGTTTQNVNNLLLTPVVKGSIIDTYLYDGGTGYGSTILNYEKKPIITIKNGKNATVSLAIVNGSINEVSVIYGGEEYYSVPTLEVIDSSGSGTGAELRAIISNNTISSVEVVNPGIGYSSTSTQIKITSSGKNCILNTKVRKLTVNDSYERFEDGKVLLKGSDKVQYSVSKYFKDLRESFLDVNPNSPSKIIGWAYDGNPIYGPYGNTDPNDLGSSIKTLSSGYTIDTSNIIDRPIGFDNGYFVEDYIFNDSGDLDEHNGRYEKNNDFPNGVYAYHATLDTSVIPQPEFPYFIGDSYNSKLETESLDQSFDFNSSNLLRNTFPYKVSESNADYDFIDEVNDTSSQEIEIDSVSSGSIEKIEILNDGIDYKVGDVLVFDEDGTSGQGLYANISSVKGKEINEITTSSTKYLNSIFTWDSETKVRVSILPNHDLKSLDYVTISGFSTNLSKLNGFYQIEVSSPVTGRCLSSITSATVGFTTEIYVSPIEENISIGSSITIGTETLKILDIFRNENILRIERGSSGVSHTVGTAVTFLADSFTISESVDKFESRVNNIVFFNPRESVGVSTISGVGYSTSFVFGNISNVTRSIPARSIHIENHPFTTNQSITFTANTSDLVVSTDGSTLTNLSSFSNLFVVNKQPNLIGIKTSITGEELFFHTNGDDNDQYTFETNYTQILGDVEKNEITVSVSTSHGLQVGDTVKLNVEPNLSVGIGTSTAVRVLYKSEIDAIVVDPIGFNSTGVSTTTNEITITDHGLVTGDKVFYEDASNSNVDKKSYYIFKINDNIFNLCETYFDTQQEPPNVVSFASTGGSTQTLSLINPEINSIRNNNLVFDLTDSSLSGYVLKIFCENTFKNEFVSTGSTNSFTVSGVGTVGVSTDASLTLEYNSDLPQDLYYTLEQNGEQIGYDNTVIDYSRIGYQNSEYTNTYTVNGVATTSFTINSIQRPERLSYASTETDTLEYTTTSLSAEGSVGQIDIINTGFGYRKLPSLKSVTTENGKDLLILLSSDTIGKEKNIRVVNNKFTYSSDKTLTPRAELPILAFVSGSSTIESIDVINASNGYASAPDIVLVNPNTREVINSGLFEVVLEGDSISAINIITEANGLPNDSTEIFTVNNSNGISVLDVESSNSGIFTCSISTPTLGFTSSPFNIGDKVFVEGIQKFGSDGSGFNSSDYGYRLLNVTNFDNTSIPNKVEISVSEFTSNTGIAITNQSYSGTLINESNYPTFNVNQTPSQFIVGEKVSVNGIPSEVRIVESTKNYLRLLGTFDFIIGDIITGNISSSVATINRLEKNDGTFDINYSNLKRLGWKDGIGKLSEDYQVTPNNDYYQNLSYSIKSPITYEDQQSPVENLVHTSGLKNFADTEFITSGISSVTLKEDTTNILYSFIEENRVDSITNFDLAFDAEVSNSRSRLIQLKNKRLTDYTEINDTLNVLKIDDISPLFSNFESQNTDYLNIEEIKDLTYFNYLIRITNSDFSNIQLTNITILSNGLESYIIENESISNVGVDEIHENGEQIGSFDLFEDALEDTYLRFTPVDPFNTDYDLKIIRQVFNESISGVGTQSVGFIDLTSNEKLETTGVGSTSLIEVNSSEFDSLYVTAQVYDTITKDIDYVKLYLTHDDSNTYMSEYYVDTNFNQLSATNSSQIGTFYSNLDSGILSIYHTNNTGNQIKIRSNIVGFGTTSVGVGTYRYILPGQPEGGERSAIYDSNYYSTVSAASTVIQTFDRNLYNASNSLIQVSVGSTKALHNIMVISDIDNNVYTQQSPFLSVGTTEDVEFDTVSGIGTFGGEISGSDVVVSFYPDPDQTEEIKIEVFSKKLYSEVDSINDYDDLVYGTVIESIDEKFYNSINGDRINRTNFSLFDNNTPIFTKVFNPDSASLTQNTGVFTIKNHFFSEGEELIYTPNSTFIGVGASAMKYTATDELPSSVFVVNRTVDTFQISTTRSGTAVTFTSLGEGNAHQFTMSERNTKTLITIDDLVQYPIAATKITHTLSGNVGGGITEGTTLFSLSGISSVNPTDILRIDDEFMGVINVGLGTTNVGPITNNGTENLVLVDRGFVGSSATSHTDSTLVRIHKGAYNIVDNEIHFAEPPRGNPQIDKTKFNLDFEISDFTGRVFLKSDYTSNKVYDDISDEFTGIGRTFTLKVGGANTTGLGTDGGNGLVFINSIYQSPQTDNNPNLFNYTINEDTVAGITTLTFSGITRPNTDPLEYVTSEVDVNVNETPRGGIIISYGSTPGLGFAPLVGASVTATVSAGTITAIGIGTTGTFGSGYNGLTAIGVSVYESGHTGGVADISATIGIGGTLAFTINDGGSGYTNPQIFVSDPSYENLPVIGVSRLGIGATTDTGIGLLVDLEVGSATGIGSTLFEVKNFNFSRPGYAFQRGDVFKPVGLVTDGSLSSPLSDFTITVLDTFSDSFAAWEFGELDYIDSIANLKDGVRKVFPLNYNGELLSFEPEPGSPVENNLSNLLVIFINGILQDPDVDYIFNGGTSFTFTTAPRVDDDVDIYFYKGSPIDTALFDDINLSLEVGDTVQVLKNNSYTDTIDQDERLVYDLSFSDKFETNLYSGLGINDDPEKAQPLTWTKKKRGSFINGQYVSKVRDSIEALVFPTARIIKDVTSTDNEIFVENTELFTYEFDNSYNNTHETDSVDALLVNGISTVTTGSVEFIGDINRISGTSGEIIGITTALGIGVDLALQFTLNDDQNFAGLQTGYPVYIHNTRIGSGVTSIDDSDSAIVGIGTTFLDNIYYISGFDIATGIITCNVKSDSNIIGLSTTGIVTDPVGRFSWGRLFSESGSLTRSNPISIGVSGNIVSGLSTYPTIQRRGGINIRSTGAIGIKTF